MKSFLLRALLFFAVLTFATIYVITYVQQVYADAVRT